MTPQEFATLKAQGKIKHVKSEPPAHRPQTSLAPDLSTYLAVLELLQRPRIYLSAAPTAAPKNFAEQIQFYKSGSTYRVYFYFDGAWRYAGLT